VEQIASPDKPAYVCYAIVIIVGLWVAYAKVSKLMVVSPDRWSFLLTWMVFLSYAAVPVALFWLLDFTSALHDTSLFAALLVAIGYRQILAGDVKGASIPSQFSALWNPFETWANQVRDRIVAKNIVRSNRSNESLQSVLAQDPKHVEELAALAYRKTEDPEQLDSLDKDLAAITASAKPTEISPEAFEANKTRRKVARCLRSIRVSNPNDYGNDLYQAKLIGFVQYWGLLGNAASYLFLLYGILFILFLLAAVGFLFAKPDNLLAYHSWRFQKVNATERDHFRTNEFLSARIHNAAFEKQKPFEIIEPLLRLLRYRDVDRKVAENILALVLEFRQPGLTEHVVPRLIDSLRTENPDVRLRIHQALQALPELTYETSKPDEDLAKWVPSKNESAVDVERRIKQYRKWWDSISASPAPKPSPSPQA
jgi:hypothetical protein